MKIAHYFTILLSIGGVFCGTTVAQQSTIAITELQFTDGNLAACVTQTATDNGWDTLGEMTALTCGDQDINSAQGIELLTALTSLDLSGNQLTEIDISANVALVTLFLIGNQLTAIDISANTALDNLWLNQNQLIEIDVSANTALVTLVLSENQLTVIDVSANSSLVFLFLFDNQLAALDVRANTDLTFLRLNQNQLTEIDLSANTALTSLWLFENQLASLDVSANTALNFLFLFDNRLTALDVSANTALTHLWLNQNQLTEIDVSANMALTSLNLSRNQLTEIDVVVNTALQVLDITENPLTQTTKEYLTGISGGSLSVSFGYDASFDRSTAVLTIPAVAVDGSFFRVELILVDSLALKFEIGVVEEIVDPNLTATAEFGFDLLLIPDVHVPDELAGTLHYRLELLLIETEPTNIFQISFAEEMN